MPRIAVVGARSFIGSSWAACSYDRVSLLSRSDVNADSFAAFDVVVNCSLHPDFKIGRYREALDEDLAIARLAADAGKHFVMLSTRKVYGIRDDRQPLRESSTVNPSDFYGANKLESEIRVRAALEDRCTVLRISNVFGYELGRRTFFGMALSRLKSEGRIELDVSPFVTRDFIPVEFLVERLTEICLVRSPGTYNLGSATGLPLGRVAQWLIGGYGRGQLLVTSLEEKDSFVFDTSKLRSTAGINWPGIDFEQVITDIGRRLALS